MAQGPPDIADEAESTTIGVWALIWTIFVAKIVTLVLVVLAAHSFETAALVSVTTWPWLVIAAVVAASPLLFRFRLRRVRAKRARLLRAEWIVSTETSAASKVPHQRPEIHHGSGAPGPSS